MNQRIRSNERGAVLLIALVMLLVMTVLAVSTMRGVALEARLTGNRAESVKLQNSAEAALREAEYRLYGPAYLRDKLEPTAANCATTNTLKPYGLNKPCLLDIQSAQLKAFMLNPARLSESNKATILSTVSASGLAWMPYRGLDTGDVTTAERNAQWNLYLITGGPAEEVPLNVEYGAAGEGRGTFFYLTNGLTDDNFAMQSSVANIYVGLNN